MKEVDLAQAMKEGMRRLASGVSVVSASGAKGERTAMTATSITSVSDQPASLLVCINRDANMNRILSHGHDFAVSLLHHHQQDISNHCAGGNQGEERFSLGSWETYGTQNTPYIADSLAVFVCQQATSFHYGTHDIVIGDIKHVMVDDNEIIDPLLYLNGKYYGAR